MAAHAQNSADACPDAWIPDHVQTYLAHVVEGRSIRSLARHAGCHASTVLRQVRRCEARRDDPLIDRALTRLGHIRTAPRIAGRLEGKRDMNAMTHADAFPSSEKFDREAERVLRRLSEQGACLAVAEGMEMAVIVREVAGGETLRTGTVESAVAEAMALRDWIASGTSGRVLRYRITGPGRAALKAYLAHTENATARAAHDDDTPDRRTRYAAESPLVMLARRKDKSGERFLEDAQVRAGERLREDFEIAAMAGIPEGGWESLLVVTPTGDVTARGSEGALARVSAALADLGPGLGDVVLRVCCKLEGLETVEQRMGWAARSGKIVLRIGLQRLERHYAEHGVKGGGLIG
ncbi:hypothetical protein SAMN04488020_11089 [Palleronia marisminoris]|uniref:DUF6456 domain-containing protein n=2 Tax=Palleronia marisminoris TaxID=315423 RepID=A0A1Y5TC58_9RHOB|nr:DUF6456 domain-containing protein [Palleronia marisminoris]SFH33622.1 hypothetical protein SAMN04488020_11089 [Palleronia marisminoris]SLN60412.1 hypothetical protein PAM7066_02989 [Palleronia marisminoris]